MPYDFVDGSDEPAPGMVPVESTVCELGAAVGRELARFADQAEPAGAPPRCHDCAFRLGTLANRSLGTLANALKCAMEGLPFYCHHGEVKGEPTRLCRGWIALSSQETLAPIAEQIAAFHAAEVPHGS